MKKAPLGKILREFIKFSFVGISSVIVQYGGYRLLLWLGVYYIVANVIAFVAAVINSYIWNTIFVFKPNKSEMPQAESEDADTQDNVADKTLEEETGGADKKAKFNHGAGFTRMIITNLGYLLLSTLLLKLFVEIIGLSEEIAPILFMIVLTPYSFFVTKYWVYKKKKTK